MCNGSGRIQVVIHAIDAVAWHSNWIQSPTPQAKQMSETEWISRKRPTNYFQVPQNTNAEDGGNHLRDPWRSQCANLIGYPLRLRATAYVNPTPTTSWHSPTSGLIERCNTTYLATVFRDFHLAVYSHDQQLYHASHTWRSASGRDEGPAET